MDPFTGSALLAAPLVSGVAGIVGQTQANIASAQSVDKQLAFQERMSSSAYSRATEDMRRAGLNPILAAGGGGMSTPGGASFSSQNTMAGVAPAMSSALEARRMSAQLDQIEAQIENTQKDTEVKDNQADLIDAQRSLAEVQAKIAGTTAKQVAFQLPSVARDANLDAGWPGLLKYFLHGLFLPGASGAGKIGSVLGGE